MKNLIVLLLLIPAMALSKRCAAQEPVDPGPQWCAQADSIVKEMNFQAYGASTIKFEKTGNCVIRLVTTNGLKITSFSFTKYLGVNVVTEDIKGDLIGLTYFTDLKKGEKVYIENIKADGGNGSVIKLKAISLVK